jgi:hypothetical protein
MSLGIGYKYLAAKPTVGNAGDVLYADLDYKANILNMGFTFLF